VVSQFDVRPDGTLAPKSAPTVPAGAAPINIAVSPDGLNAYVTNQGDTTVSQYNVAPDGALIPDTPATVPTGDQPTGVVVSPNGSSVYVTNFDDDSVSQYDRLPGGALALKTPPSVAAGSGPAGIAVSPPRRRPATKDECNKGGWRNFPGFKNQGDCVSFVATGGKNPSGGNP
jgi:DNA-binding beta-propeller fold protein YncE